MGVGAILVIGEGCLPVEPGLGLFQFSRLEASVGEVFDRVLKDGGEGLEVVGVDRVLAILDGSHPRSSESKAATKIELSGLFGGLGGMATVTLTYVLH